MNDTVVEVLSVTKRTVEHCNQCISMLKLLLLGSSSVLQCQWLRTSRQPEKYFAKPCVYCATPLSKHASGSEKNILQPSRKSTLLKSKHATIPHDVRAAPWSSLEQRLPFPTSCNQRTHQPYTKSKEQPTTVICNIITKLFHVAVICYPIPTEGSSDEPHQAQHGEGEVMVDGETVVAIDRVGEQRRRHGRRYCLYERGDHR